MEKKCKQCGRVFETYYQNKLYCSKYCYTKYWTEYDKMKQQHKIEELSSEIARLKKALERKNNQSSVVL